MKKAHLRLQGALIAYLYQTSPGLFSLPTVDIPQTMCRGFPRATGTRVPKILYRDLGGVPLISLRKPRKPIGKRKNGGGGFGGAGNNH